MKKQTKTSLAATGAGLLLLASAGNINAQTAPSNSGSAVSGPSFVAAAIPNGSITTSKLVDGCVTMSKLDSRIGVWLANGSNVFWNGRVGIGTSTPTNKLTVQCNRYGIEHTNGTRRVSTYLDPSGGWFGTISNDPLHFFTNNGAQQLTVATSGNVGIGTIKPSTKLDVAGTVSATGLRAPGAGINTGTFAFVHSATAGSISGAAKHITTIDNPLCNGDPNAILIVTHNWTKDTSVNHNHPQTVGVYFINGKWTIFNEDNTTAMESGDAFNVMVIKP